MTSPDPQETSTSRLLRDDRYEDLGPKMRERLDSAETAMHKVRDWVDLLAERGQTHWLIARELCLVLGWHAPRGQK